MSDLAFPYVQSYPEGIKVRAISGPYVNKEFVISRRGISMTTPAEGFWRYKVKDGDFMVQIRHTDCVVIPTGSGSTISRTIPARTTQTPVQPPEDDSSRRVQGATGQDARSSSYGQRTRSDVVDDSLADSVRAHPVRQTARPLQRGAARQADAMQINVSPTRQRSEDQLEISEDEVIQSSSFRTRQPSYDPASMANANAGGTQGARVSSHSSLGGSSMSCVVNHTPSPGRRALRRQGRHGQAVARILGALESPCRVIQI